MKDLTTALLQEGKAEMQASKAIQQLFKFVDERYPSLAVLTKERMIAECIIELSLENKFIQEQKFLS
jgi:hypothetical protein